MRNLLLLLGGLISLCLPMHAQSGLIPVVSTKLQDASGNLVSNATICGQVVTSNSTPMSVHVGGGGQTTQPPVCSAVTNGQFSINLPNVALANPQPCIAVTVTDNTSGNILLASGYGCVQPTSAAGSTWCSTSNGATTCNFDLYTPNFAAQAIVQTGPQGPPGTPGCVVGSGSCNTVVSTTPAANQTVTQPAGSSLNLVGSTLINGKTGCAGDGSGCRSDSGASIIGVSADGQTMADAGTSDKFFADFHPVGTNTDGTPMVPGFDAEADIYIQQNHYQCKTCGSTPAYLVRSLYATPTSFSAQATMYWVQGQNNASCIGFTGATQATYTGTASQIVDTCFTSAGWVLNIGGNTTVLPAPATSPSNYDVSIWYYNGQMYLSCVQSGTNVGVTWTISSGVTLPANLINFQTTSGNGNDRISFVRYSVGGSAPNTINMAYAPTHRGLVGELTSTTAGTTFVMVPQGYRPGVANRWVIYLHGYTEVGWAIAGAPSGSGGNAGVSSVAQGLLNAGYVVIGINETNPAGWGDQSNLTDLAAVIAEWRAKLSLAPQPYMVADSMGGYTMLNGIARGVVSPRAIVGWCIDTSLAWQYTSGGGAPTIQPAYGFTQASQYAAATAGYDPMLATTSGSNGQWLQYLVSVPTMLWSSYSDTVVLRAPNSDAYAALINGAGGNVVVNTSTGNHEDPSNFVPAAVVNFFNVN